MEDVRTLEVDILKQYCSSGTQGSTSWVPEAENGHDLGPVPSASHAHNLSL
jgi:hypothetical protein